MSVLRGLSLPHYTEFDELGLVKQSRQQTDGQEYGFSYTYNLAGALASETYPSGRTVNTSYDGVNRPNGVSGLLNAQGKNYLSNVGYWAHGALNYYALGSQPYPNNVYAVYSYNSRLQMSGFYASLANAANGYLGIWSYDWGGTDNNGNLKSVTQKAGRAGDGGGAGDVSAGVHL